MKILRYFFVAIITLLTVWFAFSHALAQVKRAPMLQTTAVHFAGKLLVASDADQIGTAYADGIINKVAGVEDSLTILQFDQNGNLSKSQVHVSNSVISWPSVIAHSPDGRLVYVVETYGVYRGSQQKMNNVYVEMPTGKYLTIVDISNGQSKIAQQVEIGTNPKTASVNAKGDLFVTSSQEKGRELVIAKLENGLVTHLSSFAVKGLVRAGLNGGINFVEFHPTLDVIAAIIDNRSVAFFSVVRQGDALDVEPMGEVRDLGKVLSVGNFAADGKFFIASDVGWGDSRFGNVFNNKGYLISIQFDEKGQHKFVNKTKVGLSPEGFDVSPDGKWAIAVNMRRTYLPKGLPYNLFAARKISSLSLVKIDPQSGELSTIGKEYGFEGELPEDAVFDLDGKAVAVAIFNQRFEKFPKQGYVEFWQLQDEKLVRTTTKIPITRGPHSIKVVR